MFLQICLSFYPHMCVWTGGNENNQKQILIIVYSWDMVSTLKLWKLTMKL